MQDYLWSLSKFWSQNVNAFDDVVHSSGYLSYTKMHDPSISWDFPSSPDRTLPLHPGGNLAHAWSAVALSPLRFLSSPWISARGASSYSGGKR